MNGLTSNMIAWLPGRRRVDCCVIILSCHSGQHDFMPVMLRAIYHHRQGRACRHGQPRRDSDRGTAGRGAIEDGWPAGRLCLLSPVAADTVRRAAADVPLWAA